MLYILVIECRAQLLPVAYGLGLAFLKKQYRQERKARQTSTRLYDDNE